MFYPKLEGPPLEAYNVAVQTIRQRAIKELNLDPEQIIVRPMRPDDLDLTAEWTWTTGTSADTATYINAITVNDNRFMAIYGISYADNDVSQLTINRGGSDARIWNIQHINNFTDNVAYVDDPVTMDQNTQVTIKGYAINSATTKLIFIGVVAERRGIIINP